MAEETTIERIRGVVARGWCHSPNSSKIFDPDLAEAISDEVRRLFDAILENASHAPRQSEPARKMIGSEALGNGNDHFGVHLENAFCKQRGCKVDAPRQSEQRFIGDLRRELFLSVDCEWNGVVRDKTAEVEQPGMLVDEVAVLKLLAEWLKNKAFALGAPEGAAPTQCDAEHKYCGCFANPDSDKVQPTATQGQPTEHDLYAGYANHCAIQKKVPLTFHSRKREGSPHAPQEEKK